MKPVLYCALLLFASISFGQTIGWGDDFELQIPAGTARLPESDAYDTAVKTARVVRHNKCLPSSPAVGPCVEDPAVVATWRAALTAAGAVCWQVPPTDAAVAAARAYAFARGLQCVPATVPVLAVPSRPLNVVAVAGNGQATISFGPPASNGGSPIINYKVSNAANAGNHLYGPGSPITLTGLVNGTAYTFTVQANNAQGLGAASLSSNAVVPGP